MVFPHMALLDDERFHHMVLDNRRIGPHAFVLRFERRDLDFAPGQYLSVGLAGDLNIREYSIYSGSKDPFLEILVREVEGGMVSQRLAQLKTGDMLRVEGPFGFFTLETGPVFMVASGTGIAPFHAMVRSSAVADFTLLHGIRSEDECYGADEYPQKSYIPCISQTANKGYHGRVTDWLLQHPDQPSNGTGCYLSGNCDMIYDVYDILRKRGISSEQIRAEVYF